MKNLLYIFIWLIFIPNYVKANDWMLDAQAQIKTKQITLPNVVTFISTEINGTWDDNLGFYGKFSCYGYIEKYKSNVKLNTFCEFFNQFKEKWWSISMRDSSEVEAGIGKSTLVRGEGRYKKLNNQECTYASKLLDDVAFIKSKCILSAEVLESITK